MEIMISVTDRNNKTIGSVELTSGERVALNRHLADVVISECDSDNQAVAIYKLYRMFKDHS